MSMSEQQIRTLGLSHVRRRVTAGKYTTADVKRWEAELGPQVHEIVEEAELYAPRATPPRSVRRRKSAPPKPAPAKQSTPDTTTTEGVTDVQL